MSNIRQTKSASEEEKGEPSKQDVNCWGPVIEIKGVKIPLIAVALVAIGIVVGAAGAYFVSIKPDIIDPLVKIGVQKTVAAWPTWTPLPTYTPYPTPLASPTMTPTPTKTPMPTNTPIPTSTPGVLRSQMVAIRTFHGRFVTAMNDQPGWNWELRAETSVIGDWERFILLYLNNNRVALKTYHGRFVSAMDNSGCCNWVLRAEKKARNACEEFTLVDLGGGKVAFETCYGKYVTAFDSSRCWMLRADAQSIGDWEQFTLVPQE